VLTKGEGEIVDSATVEHGMEVPRPGWAEQDADAVWWHDVVALPCGSAFLVQDERGGR